MERKLLHMSNSFEFKLAAELGMHNDLRLSVVTI